MSSTVLQQQSLLTNQLYKVFALAAAACCSLSQRHYQIIIIKILTSVLLADTSLYTILYNVFRNPTLLCQVVLVLTIVADYNQFWQIIINSPVFFLKKAYNYTTKALYCCLIMDRNKYIYQYSLCIRGDSILRMWFSYWQIPNDKKKQILKSKQQNDVNIDTCKNCWQTQTIKTI